MTVPLSEAVASMVPVELMARKEMGDLCAWTTLATVRVRVENRRTSPDWELEPVLLPAAPDVDPAFAGCVERGDVGEGTGDG
jgi:hypothetical protein